MAEPTPPELCSSSSPSLPKLSLVAPFLSASDQTPQPNYHFIPGSPFSSYRKSCVCNIGPGTYSARTPFGPRVVSQFSKAGYYMAIENGRLLRRKQQFFASVSNQPLRSFPPAVETEDQSPGPGSYCPPVVLHTHKPNQQRRSASEVRAGKLASENAMASSTPRINVVCKLGPGTYNVSSQQTRPRITGVTQWDRSRTERAEFRLFKKDEQESSPETTQNEERVAPRGKGNSPFESRVPRFQDDNKASQEKTEKQKDRFVTMIQHEDCKSGVIVIEKTLDETGRENSPGPERYLDPGRLSTLNSKKTCAFAKHDRFRSVPPQLSSVGPGAYSPSQSPYSYMHHGDSLSKAKKELNLANPETVPGPGNYSPSDGV